MSNPANEIIKEYLSIKEDELNHDNYIGSGGAFFVSGLFMKWGVQIMSPHNEVESEEDNLEEKKSEEMISEL